MHATMAANTIYLNIFDNLSEQKRKSVVNNETIKYNNFQKNEVVLLLGKILDDQSHAITPRHTWCELIWFPDPI